MKYVSGEQMRILASNLYYLEEQFNMELPDISIIDGKVEIICIMPRSMEMINNISFPVSARD